MAAAVSEAKPKSRRGKERKHGGGGEGDGGGGLGDEEHALQQVFLHFLRW